MSRNKIYKYYFKFCNMDFGKYIKEINPIVSQLIELEICPGYSKDPEVE